MDVLEAISGRTSTRAFLDKPVSQELIRKILDVARWAPSGVNTQPWQVVAVTGPLKEQIGDALVEARENGQETNWDYKYYMDRFPEPYSSRRKACGLALYGALGIGRDDTEKRKDAWYRNYYGFGAPAELFIFIDREMEKGSWVDMGLFIQSVMLAARGFGLETCPQASMAEYPDIVRGLLDVPRSMALICGVAIGYADSDHPINNYRTARDPVDSFTRWFGFE